MSLLLTAILLVTLILHAQGQTCDGVAGSGCVTADIYLNDGQPTPCNAEVPLGPQMLWNGSVLCTLDAPFVAVLLQNGIDCGTNVGDQPTCDSWLSSCCSITSDAPTSSPTMTPTVTPPTPPPIPGCVQLGIIPGAPDYSAVFDSECDLDFNFANCSFDNDACCDEAGELPCADPQSPFFNSDSATCMECYLNASLLADGSCAHMSEVHTCLVNNNCAQNNERFNETIIFHDELFVGACAQPLCDVDAAVTCLLSTVFLGDITSENCVQRRLLAQNCFVDQGCTESFEDLLKLSSDFDVCSGVPLLPPLCFGSLLTFGGDVLDAGDQYSDGVCNLYLNTLECEFDGGDCCTLDDSSLCINPLSPFYSNDADVCMQCFTSAPSYSENDFCPFFVSVEQCLVQNNCETEAGVLAEQLGTASFFTDVCTDPQCNELDLFVCISEAFSTSSFDGDDCVDAYSEIARCFPPAGCVVGNFFAQILGEFASSCTIDGSGITIDYDTCANDYILSPFDDIDFRNVFDTFCSAAYNVPGCNFDSGACCLGGPSDPLCVPDNPTAAPCMACLEQASDILKGGGLICDYEAVLNSCFSANSCDSNPFLAGFNFQIDLILEPLCSDPACDVDGLFKCSLDLPDPETVPFCEDFATSLECFVDFGCSKEFYINNVLSNSINGTNETIESCYDCDFTLDVDFSFSPELAAAERCDVLVLTASPNISEGCARYVTDVNDLGGLTDFYAYEWTVLPSSTGGVSAPKFLKSLTIPLFEYDASNGILDLSVRVTSLIDPQFTAVKNITVNVEFLIGREPTVKTSVSGSVSMYTNQFRSFNGRESCNPNAIGCDRCPPSGFTEFIDPALPDSVARDILGLAAADFWNFQWQVSCNGGPPCALNDGNSLTFDVDGSILDPAQSPYELTFVMIENGEGFFFAPPITLEVFDASSLPVDCDIPLVEIFAPTAQAVDTGGPEGIVNLINKVTQSVQLIGKVTDSTGAEIVDPSAAGITLEWEYAGNIVSLQDFYLVPPAVFEAGKDEYNFTVTAKQACTEPNHPSATIFLRVNQPPQLGFVSVSPTQGDVNTQFVLDALNYVDPEGHTPLKYSFLVNGVVVRNSLPDTSFTLPLAGPEGGEGFVDVQVKVVDFYGAATTSAPFPVFIFQSSLDDVDSSVFDTLTQQGADESTLLVNVKNIIGVVNTDANNTGTTKAQNLRKKSFDVIVSVARSLESQNSTTFEFLALQANGLKEVLSKPEELADDDIEEVVDFLQEFITTSQEQDVNSQDGTEDQFFQDVLQAAARLLRELVGDPDSSSRRRLQNGTVDCTNVENTRGVINGLGLLRTRDDIAGSLQRTVESDTARVVAVSARSNKLSDLGALIIGDLNVTLPEGLSNSTNVITTLLAQYDFNLRTCDDSGEDFIGVFVSEDECDSLLDSVPVDFDGPLKPVESVVSLEFRNGLDDGGDIAFEPTELDERIVLRIPFGDLNDDGLCLNFTTLSCGFFDLAQEVFVTDGCEVTDIDLDSNVLECSCNHASDYAAWQAFNEDVRNVFSKPVVIITLLAILLCAGILGAVFVTYFGCLVWGHRRDMKSARALQKEAVGLMVLNQFLAKQRQRQFFANLKEAVNKEREARQEEKIGETAPVPKASARGNICKRMLDAVRYEHSLLNLVRYDPHYTRVQRVSVFIAVVMGNLFVAALAFELKDSEIDELSTGFIILVVLISSLAVAIPIRLVIKMLFRITEFEKGSESERVAQLFRISREAESSFENVMNNPQDVALVHAFKRIYIAKARLETAEKNAGMEQKTCCSFRGKKKNEQDSGAPVVEGEDVEDAKEVYMQEVHDAQVALEEATTALKEATEAAKQDWTATNSAEATARVKMVTKQKSTFMKIAALVQDEASPIAKSRKALCPHFMVYFSWITLLLLYGLSVFYVVRFVVTRGDRAAEEGVTRTEEELLGVWLTTAAIGIVVGYCLAEPIIAIVRYAILPYCVLKWGTPVTDDDDEVDVIEDEEERQKREFETSMRQFEASIHIMDEVPTEGGQETDGVENNKKKKNKGTRGQIMLEFVSDLIETIY